MSEAQEQLISAIERGSLEDVVDLHRKALKYFDIFHIFEDDYDVTTASSLPRLHLLRRV